MYKMIKAAYAEPVEPSYSERQELAKQLDAIVRKYFDDNMRGRPAPYVSWSRFNILYYEFRYNNSYRDSTTHMYAKGYEHEATEILNNFRKEARAFLKSLGFTKVKFDIKSVKYYYSYGDTKYDVKKELIGIYFDYPDHQKPIQSSKSIEASVSSIHWEELDSKMVYDSDGFTTDYTLYKQVDAEYYVCIFGDKDLYGPDNTEPDFDTEIEDEAWDWFMEYESLEGENYDL